jgi:ABC-2 type transport system ATP-binding protein
MILAVEGLSKTYKSFKKEAGFIGSLKALVHRELVEVPAVVGLDFKIEKGEFVGLLGPNGAGKTTTLKMLTGLIPPSAGRAAAFGQYDTAQRLPAYLRRIGLVMGQRNQLHADLPPIDSFRLAQAIYALPEQRFERRLQECLALFSIESKLHTPVRKLSLGERMKMELILAILHEPELLFLDEPTIGLDFNAARQIRDFLAKANAQLGITVVLTSHYTKDIEELCRRVILINHGRIVYDGPLSGVDARIQDQRMATLTLDSRGRVASVLAALEAAGLDPLPDDGNAAEVRFVAGRARIARAMTCALSAVPAEAIVDLKVAERGVDEIFAEIYQRPRT